MGVKPAVDDLLAELRADSPGVGQCGFGRWLAEQPDGTQTSLTAAFDDQQISTAAITRWAQRHGYEGSDSVTKKHRTGACACRK